MGRLVNVVVLLCCVSSAIFSDPGDEEEATADGEAEACVMELSCAECVPDAMPLVTSHAAAGGRVRAAPGDEVSLSCGRGGRFLAYPLRAAVTGVCERGRLRVRHDGRLRHLLELGCQEDLFEDVQHPVEHCDSPLQGRAYQTLEGGVGGAEGVRHLATVCFDADRARAAWARAASGPRGLRLPAHEERSGPLSLLGNFNHMFDAKSRADAARLFADGAHMTRRLRELLRHDRVSLAAQSLAAGRLLAPAYFDDQDARVADFASNRVAVWASVAAGNLRHLHADVARLLRRARARARALIVYAGTHGVLSLRTGEGEGAERRELYLAPGRFPVPRYVWTVVHEPAARRALALVLLNDPLLAVSDVRAAVFCESACGRVPWLRDLTAGRHYESPVFGLVFCCDVHSLAARVPEVPKGALQDVPAGDAGMLLDAFT